jgi:hypothetical protein
MYFALNDQGTWLSKDCAVIGLIFSGLFCTSPPLNEDDVAVNLKQLDFQKGE